MSLGKIHEYGLYLPSQKSNGEPQEQGNIRRTLRQRRCSSSRAPMSPKGIKRSAQKVLHVKNRIKGGGSFGVKNQRMPPCKATTTMQVVRRSSTLSNLRFDALRVVVVPLLTGQAFGASGGAFVIATTSARVPLLYWFSAATCA